MVYANIAVCPHSACSLALDTHAVPSTAYTMSAHQSSQTCLFRTMCMPRPAATFCQQDTLCTHRQSQSHCDKHMDSWGCWRANPRPRHDLVDRKHTCPIPPLGNDHQHRVVVVLCHGPTKCPQTVPTKHEIACASVAQGVGQHTEASFL